MKRLYELIRKLLAGPAFAILLLMFVAPAFAQYGGYSAGYSAPIYRNVWSGWEYKVWPTDPKYYTYHRTWWDHCGTPKNEYDGWLYCLDAHGCYVRHCLISQYGYKPKLGSSPYFDPHGQTEAAYHGDQLALAKALVALTAPGVLAQKNLPFPGSANDILAPSYTTADARVANAHRESMSAKEYAAKIYQAEQDKEKLDLQIRGQIAILREEGQQDERLLAEFKEFRAVRLRQSKISAGAGTQVTIDVPNNELAEIIATKCVSCHGPQKQEGNLDFRNAGSLGYEKWNLCSLRCAAGEMPKDAPKLTLAQTQLFSDQAKIALKAGRE